MSAELNPDFKNDDEIVVKRVLRCLSENTECCPEELRMRIAQQCVDACDDRNGNV